MFTDLVIILIAVYTAIIGSRRGLVLVAIELVSFVLAGAVAFSVYRYMAAGLQSWTSISLPLANVTSFVVIWLAVELAAAALVRYLVIPRLSRTFQRSNVNRIGGAVGSGIRAIVLISLGLMVFAGLPLSAAAKAPVLDSTLAHALLSATNRWQSAVGSLGGDLGASLTTFTIKADPESTQRIELGFKTTDFKPDPDNESADLELINFERSKAGLPPLTINREAQVVARAYAARMLADGVFSHIDNDGHNPFDRLRAAGVGFNAAGENLALGPTLLLAHQGLMNSPGHKANILSRDYKRVGIGVLDAGEYGLMVVQDFTD